jgi:hypothetical protein
MDSDDREQFSVVMFYTDDSHQYLCRFVSARIACEIWKDAILIAEAAPHLMSKVIITDGGDHTNALWEVGKGLAFPTPEDLERRRGDAHLLAKR